MTIASVSNINSFFGGEFELFRFQGFTVSLVLRCSVLQLPTKNANSISSKLDWGYVTEPQKHACGGNKDSWPRAKVLGMRCSLVLFRRNMFFDYR